MILYRPVGLGELELIAGNGWRSFPPRFPQQPIFYPVLTAKYAEAIASNWNTKDPNSGYVGFVTQFEIDDTYVSRFPVQTAGSREDQELWVPADELEQFNHHILGLIRVIATFAGPDFKGEINPLTHLPVSVSPH